MSLTFSGMEKGPVPSAPLNPFCGQRHDTQPGRQALNDRLVAALERWRCAGCDILPGARPCWGESCRGESCWGSASHPGKILLGSPAFGLLIISLNAFLIVLCLFPAVPRQALPGLVLLGDHAAGKKLLPNELLFLLVNIMLARYGIRREAWPCRGCQATILDGNDPC